MTAENLPIIVAIAVGVLTFWLLFKPFFGEERDFWQCLGYHLKPDFMSWLDKDLQRDYSKSIKLGVFTTLCSGAGFIAWYVVKLIVNGS